MSIIFEGVSHTYSPNTPFSFVALKDVNLTIPEGKIIGIVGATGSGKTTLVQHLNALLLPTSGRLEICGREIISNEKPKNLKSLRKQVGLVFQFPEYQLFEETILKDVSFGPLNFGISKEEALVISKDCLRLVGIDESYYERSPLDLSGGQKRRVAIAGILAINPSVLVLDEPTAGLDPQGATRMMELFKNLNKELNKTIIIVTHDMEQVLKYCEEVVVLKEGEVIYQDKVMSFFKEEELLSSLKITTPAIIRTRLSLNRCGFNIAPDLFTIDELAKAIATEVKAHE